KVPPPDERNVLAAFYGQSALWTRFLHTGMDGALRQPLLKYLHWALSGEAGARVLRLAFEGKGLAAVYPRILDLPPQGPRPRRRSTRPRSALGSTVPKGSRGPRRPRPRSPRPSPPRRPRSRSRPATSRAATGSRCCRRDRAISRERSPRSRRSRTLRLPRPRS